MSTIRKNDRKNTLKQTKHQTKSQLVYKQITSHVTKAAGIEVFYDPKNESALVGTNRLVKDRSRKAGLIQERSLTKLAPGVRVLVPVFFLNPRFVDRLGLGVPVGSASFKVLFMG